MITNKPNTGDGWRAYYSTDEFPNGSPWGRPYVLHEREAASLRDVAVSGTYNTYQEAFDAADVAAKRWEIRTAKAWGLTGKDQV